MDKETKTAKLPPGITRRHGKYLARWRDRSGKEMAKTFGSIAAAETHLSAIRDAKASGNAMRPKTILDLYCIYWRRECGKLAPSTKLKKRYYFVSYVAPTFGDAKLGTIYREDVQAWADDLLKRATKRSSGELRLLKPNTVDGALAQLRMVLSFAVAEGWIDRDPTAKVFVAGAKARREVEPISLEEREALRRALEDLDPRWGVFVDLAADTGLRIGEIQALRVGNLDLENRTVKVDSGVQRGPKTRIVGPKTLSGRRKIPALSPEACERLRAVVEGLDVEDFVVPSLTGKMLNQSNFRNRVFDPVALKLGLDITPHDLRHHAISVWLNSGVDELTAAKWAGHSDVRMIRTVYGHALDRDNQTWFDTLDSGRAALSQEAGEPSADQSVEESVCPTNS